MGHITATSPRLHCAASANSSKRQPGDACRHTWPNRQEFIGFRVQGQSRGEG